MPKITRSTKYQNHLSLIQTRKIQMNTNEIFFTSDLHFFHENIIKYCDRPFSSANEMNKALISLWNNKIPKDAEVYVLGDLTLLGNDKLGSISSIVSKLNGSIHLVLGNHDHISVTNYTDIGIMSVHYPYLQLPNGWICIHDPALATACPSNSVILSGHMHGLYGQKTKTEDNKIIIDVGVDAWEYTPVEIGKIEHLVKESL
jgi:calcineurin-like phosphoesterase family protein